MENLHLKNLSNIPKGYLVLQKLYNLKQNNIEYVPREIIKETTTYIKSLNFKNKINEEFIKNFLILLNDPYHILIENLDLSIKIVTLLYKYKLNELDINSQLNFNKINNHLIHNTDKIKSYLTDDSQNAQNMMKLTYQYYLFKKMNYKTLTIIGSYNIIIDIY